jgi:ABC-type branched-subunit amino acid transport system substrate-binding protein
MSKNRGISAMAATAALALVITACTSAKSSSGSTGGSSAAGPNQASAPGVTATTVTVGSHQPLTGPAAPGYSEIAPAMNAYFRWVNDRGGINGRTINFKYLDDGYNPTTTVTVTKQLVLQDKVYAILGGLGTPTHTKVLDFLNSSRVPDLFVSSGCQCWNQPSKYPYTFGWQPDYYVEGKILGQYVKQNFTGRKVAYFYQDDGFGADGQKGLDTQIDKALVVERQGYQPGNTDVSAQVSAIARAKPDVVVLYTIPAYTALFKLNALRLGFNPQLVVSNVGADAITLSGLLEAYAKQGGASVKGGQLIEGLVSDSYLPALRDSSNSWVTLFKQIKDKYAPTLPFDANVGYGLAVAYTFVQALQAAGKNPTRQGLVDAVQKGGFTGPGLVPFRFSKDDHSGYTGVQIGTIKSGALVLQGTPLVTDDGTGVITPYTAKQPEAPARGVPAG